MTTEEDQQNSKRLDDDALSVFLQQLEEVDQWVDDNPALQPFDYPRRFDIEKKIERLQSFGAIAEIIKSLPSDTKGDE